jgi:hypothetical protein
MKNGIVIPDFHGTNRDDQDQKQSVKSMGHTDFAVPSPKRLRAGRRSAASGQANHRTH